VSSKNSSQPLRREIRELLGRYALWCFLTNLVKEHDNIQIINNLVLVEFTIKIAGPLHHTCKLAAR